jgi:hypothetical protein
MERGDHAGSGTNGRGITVVAGRMWYKLRPMPRRKVSVTLLAILAVQMLGGMVFASVCLEPCPDDTEETTCPPVCTLCTSCTHAQTAIVQDSSAGTPLLSAGRFLPQHLAAISSHLTDDIFHVPLPG